MKKCSGFLVGISRRDLRHACACHWMQKTYPNSAYYERPKK